jgi:hypothetical protein
MGLDPPELCPSRVAVHRLRADTLMSLGSNREAPQTTTKDTKQAPHPRKRPERDALRGSPASRVLLHARSRHRHRRVRPAAARSSRGFPPLQGVPPRWTDAAFTASPLMRLSEPVQAPTRTHSRVLTPDEIGWSPKRLPTLLGFVTSWPSTAVRIGRGSGVTSSETGVRHRPPTPHL